MNDVMVTNTTVHTFILRLIKLPDLLLACAPFSWVWIKCYASNLPDPYYWKGEAALIALFIAVFFYFVRTYDAFSISTSRISELAFGQALAVFFADFIMAVALFFLNRGFYNFLPLLIAFVTQLLLVLFWSYCAHKLYFRIFPPRRTAVVYYERQDIAETIAGSMINKKFQVEANLYVDDCLKDLSLLDGFEVVFLGGIPSHDRNVILKYCVASGIDVYAIPRVGDTIMSGAKPAHILHLPMVHVGRYNPRPEYKFAKRMSDIFISAAALIILLPLEIITAVLIKAYDGGPVFYRQTRLTQNRREFQLIKFRSMRPDAEADGVARLSSGDKDDRVTPVGRFIRKCRIDELPQLINVLRGEMSIVGPRPERPEIAAQYEKELPEFALRLQVNAGITGYAQVYGKYNTNPYDKLQMDLMYIANPSLIEDMHILFSTFKILAVGESTEGIAPDRNTAL